MPQITVYIRNEDLDKWKALPNKAQAVRDMLNKTSTTTKQPEPVEDEDYDLEQMRDLPISEQVEMLGYKWDRTVKMAWDESQERHWPVVVTNGLAEVKAA